MMKRMGRPHQCQIDGCTGTAQWWVSKAGRSRKHVCRRCRNEMTTPVKKGGLGYKMDEDWN